jgi:hypothetical protein
MVKPFGSLFPRTCGGRLEDATVHTAREKKDFGIPSQFQLRRTLISSFLTPGMFTIPNFIITSGRNR